MNRTRGSPADGAALRVQSTARLLETETVGQGIALVSPVIEQITRPT